MNIHLLLIKYLYTIILIDYLEKSLLLFDKIQENLSLCNEFLKQKDLTHSETSKFRLYRSLSYLRSDIRFKYLFKEEKCGNLIKFAEEVREKFNIYLLEINKDDNSMKLLLENILKRKNINYEKNKIIETELVDFFVEPNICYIIPRKHEMMFEHLPENLKTRFQLSRAELVYRNYEIREIIGKNENEMEEEFNKNENVNYDYGIF